MPMFTFVAEMEIGSEYELFQKNSLVFNGNPILPQSPSFVKSIVLKPVGG